MPIELEPPVDYQYSGRDPLADLKTTLDAISNALFPPHNTTPSAQTDPFSIGAGITNLGTLIAQAIMSLANAFGDKFIDAFQRLGNWFGAALDQLGQWLWNTFGNIGSSVQQAFQWIWNGLVYIADQAVNALQEVWNFIVGLVLSVYNQIGQGLSAIPQTINAYFGTIANSWRGKVKELIIYNLTLHTGWGAISKFADDPMKMLSLKGIASMFVAPFAGLITGSVLASVLDSLIPQSTGTIGLMPEFSLPSLNLQTMSIQNVSKPTAPALGGQVLPLEKRFPCQIQSNILFDVKQILQPQQLNRHQIATAIKYEVATTQLGSQTGGSNPIFPASIHTTIHASLVAPLVNPTLTGFIGTQVITFVSSGGVNQNTPLNEMNLTLDQFEIVEQVVTAITSVSTGQTDTATNVNTLTTSISVT